MSMAGLCHRTCLFVSFLSVLVVHVSANCFYPNGTDRNYPPLPSNLYQACNTSAPASMCCALDSTSVFLNSNSGTVCRNDGLCISENGKAVVRAACTDQTWQAPECVKLCVNGTNQANEDVFITPCGDGSYCCGNDAIAQSCCQSGQGYFLVNGEETTVNPNTTTQSSSISPTSGQHTVTQTASSASQTASGSSKPQSGNSTNTGAIVGGVVGGVLGLVAIIGVCWFLIRRRQNRPTPPLKPDSRYPLELGDVNIIEAPTYTEDAKRNEMPGAPVSRPELDASEEVYHELGDRS